MELLDADVRRRLQELKVSPTDAQTKMLHEKGTFKHYIKVFGLLVVILKGAKLNPTYSMMLKPDEQKAALENYTELLKNYCLILLEGKPLQKSNMVVINEIHQSIYKKGA